MDIYVDEAATDWRQEIAVVAAVIVNPHEQVHALHRMIDEAVNDVVPAPFRDDFYFHAKDVKNSRAWSMDEGIAIVDRWVRILSDASLNLSVAWCRKAGVVPEEDATMDPRTLRREENNLAHVLAFTGAVCGADEIIRTHFPTQAASVFAEDGGPMKRHINSALAGLRGGTLKSPLHEKGITHIYKAVGYYLKRSAPLLQLADALAFSVSRFVHRKPDGQKYIHTLMGDNFSFDDKYIDGMGAYVTIVPTVREIAIKRIPD